MRIKAAQKNERATCGEGEYCVQLYSRRAALVTEFCLDARENNIPDLAAAEHLVRQTLTPCDFAAATVTLISDDGLDSQAVLQFDLNPA